jgi:hypothetical protein
MHPGFKHTLPSLFFAPSLSNMHPVYRLEIRQHQVVTWPSCLHCANSTVCGNEQIERTVSRYVFPVVAFAAIKNNHKNFFRKGMLMKMLKTVVAAMMISVLTGCLSVSSTGRGPQGPQGPQGEPGQSEKVIVVPERSY